MLFNYKQYIKVKKNITEFYRQLFKIGDINDVKIKLKKIIFYYANSTI